MRPMKWCAELDPLTPLAVLASETEIRVEIEEVLPGLAPTLGWLEQRFDLAPDRLTFDAEITDEGELTTVIEGVSATDAIVCALVDGDLACTRIVGRGPLAQCRTQVLALARSITLGLGYERRRRFQYACPPGWSEHNLGLFRDLRPSTPGAVIAVPPALPVRTPPPLLDRLRLEQGKEMAQIEVLERRVMRADSGLTGPLLVECGVIDGERQLRATASLSDDTFLYCLRLDAREHAADEALAAYLEVLSSILPIPRRRQDDEPAQLFGHWVG